jgi:hypothetical protein
MPCGLLQAAAAEFAKLTKPTTMSEDMDEEQQQRQQAEGSEGDEWEDEADEDDQPSYEFRFECAKMLLELDDTTETAIQVGVLLLGVYWQESAALCAQQLAFC